MSTKNFVSYGDAETLFTGVGNKLGAINNNVSQIDTNLDVPNRKNLLKATLADIKAINTTDGTWEDNVYTSNSGQLVATVNTDSDGYITSISVNAPVNVTANRAMKIPVVSLSGNYKFSGGAGEKTDIYMWDVTMSARCKIWDGETSSGSSTSIEYNQLQIVKNNTVEMRIRLLSGASAGTYVFYPMIVEPYVTNTTFAPYVPSVEDRLEEAESDIVTINSKMAGLEYDGFAGQSICYFESNNPNVEIYITGAGTTIENALGSEDTSKNLYMIRFTADAPATLTGRLFEYDEEYPVATMNPDLPIVYFDGTPFTREIHAGDYIIIKLTGTNPLTGVIVADFDSTSTGLRSDVDDTIGWDNHKNLLPVTLDVLKRNNTSGIWNDNAYTKDGITYTVLLGNYNEVLGIDVNGTGTANTDLQITDIVDVSEYTGKIINGMPNNNLRGFKLSVAQNTSPWTAYRDEDGSGGTIGQYTGTTGYAYISVGYGETVSHAIVRPMISDNGGEFKPYHPVLGPVVEDHESRIEAVESGLTNQGTYSETPVKIGNWLGHDLYRKVIDIGNLPDSLNKRVASLLTNERVVNIYGYAVNSGYWTITLPFISASDSNDRCELAYDTGNHAVSVSTNADFSSFSGIVVVEYYTVNS